MQVKSKSGRAFELPSNQEEADINAGRENPHLLVGFYVATIVLIINTVKGGVLPMARTTSVTIGAPLDDFVGKLIESGRYGSTSEIVRSALRLLERQENQLAALKQAVEAGEQSGESDFSLRDIAARVKQQHSV